MPFQRKLKGADGVIDLILWHRGMLSFGGLWPTDKRGLRYYILLAYILIHTTMVIGDFVMVFGSMGLMIDNLREMALIAMIITKLISLRYSTVLPELMCEGQVNEDNYENNEEKKIYAAYIDIGLGFSKLTLGINMLANIAHYLKASQAFIISEISGGPPVFVLPYHTRRFYNITEVHTYLLVYAYSSPVIYVFFCYSLIGCFLVSFIYHVCGQLSVLSHRVRNTTVSRATMDDSLEFAFLNIIRQHNKLIKTCKTINSIFSLALFIELIICTVIQALCMYQIIVNSSLGNAFVLFSFLLYTTSSLLVMCNYCVAGDCIMRESMNFHDSWYECQWYDMPPRCKRSIIICMIRAGIPLNLTGGGILIYSLESFTGIVKSSLAYVSMLRQFL